MRSAIDDGQTLEQLLDDAALGAQYVPPPDSPAFEMAEVLQGFHRLNVLQTYREESAPR